MIEIINVSKKFRIWEDRSRDLKETAINFLRGKKRSYRDLWALKGIDLEIHEGETVAFIGRNGSGKSTLLKLLAGIYVPEEGRIAIRGKISSLLELGVGFHQDLTGEENIFLNGAMLGFDRKEMEQRFDEILSFSEIGNFVYSPIRTYSSGMLMRLGFSIAMCVNPDILLIDEVLAVGDEAFQEKCFDRLGTFKASGKTIVLVSHSMELVQDFCDRAILLHEGKVVKDGPPEETIETYHQLISLKRDRVEKDTVQAEKDKVEESTAADEETSNPDQAVGGETSPSTGERPVETVAEGSLDTQGKSIALEASPGEPFDPSRLRMMEIQDPSFFAEKLFFETFGHSPPTDPRNYIVIYPDREESAFRVVGFIHVGETEAGGLKEAGFLCGVCVENRWRGKGIEKMLLSSVEVQLPDKSAFFIYTPDKLRFAEQGYEALPHPYLMVKWMKTVSSEEKTRLVGAAMAIGPF